MNAWLKIENAINKVILMIQEFLAKLFSSVVPKKLKPKKVASGSVKIAPPKPSKPKFNPEIIKEKLTNIAMKLKEFFLTIIETIKGYVFSIKNVGTSPSGKYKRKPKLKEILIAVFPFLVPILLKVKNWYLSLKPTTLLLVTVTGSVGIVTGVEVYKSTMEVVEDVRQAEVVVKEAKKEEKNKKRPDYYKNQEKQLLISAVAMPVYIEKVTSIKSLIVDFTLVTSNRYLKQFFLNNEHLIKDRLNTTVRPVIPEFPLTNEGKQIIREKIQNEMNVLIEEWKIKGNIESVHFHNIIAS